MQKLLPLLFITIHPLIFSSPHEAPGSLTSILCVFSPAGQQSQEAAHEGDEKDGEDEDESGDDASGVFFL